MHINAEDEESFDSTTIDVSQFAANCITKMTQILSDELVDPVAKFALTKIQDRDSTWKDHYGALLLIGSCIREY